eukprot:CAMPEP_0184530728 /NCGR_PEP_ID=MMETSP0198_2-20121128/13122_1 /TAXON_ID=1112570 /ORGANISM="Thraustochytrium sp., Strain LLF1b" /LENGTH=437 /DNA_ID=CAMNT_0026922945 /DNA_START=613 /DNA_END=1926 /DNA_ORIENTATION=-
MELREGDASKNKLAMAAKLSIHEKQRAAERMMFTVRDLVTPEQFKELMTKIESESDVQARMVKLMEILHSIDHCLAKRCVLRVKSPKSEKVKMSTRACICQKAGWANKRPRSEIAREAVKRSRPEPMVATSIHQAIKIRNTAQVATFLETNPDCIYELGACKLTPLMLAAELGVSKAIDLLVRAGAPVDAVDELTGRSALGWAVLFGQIQCVEVLLEHGADVNVMAKDGTTPLLMCAKEGFEDIADVLIAKQADPNVTVGPFDHTAAHIAAREGHTPFLVLLAQCGETLDRPDRNGMSPLLLAARANKVESALALAELGCDVAHCCNKGMGVVHYVAQRGHVTMLSALLASVITCRPCIGQLNKPINQSLMTPLMLAAEFGRTQAIDVLLEHGVACNAKNADVSPLPSWHCKMVMTIVSACCSPGSRAQRFVNRIQI